MTDYTIGITIIQYIAAVFPNKVTHVPKQPLRFTKNHKPK